MKKVEEEAVKRARGDVVRVRKQQRERENGDGDGEVMVGLDAVLG